MIASESWGLGDFGDERRAVREALERGAAGNLLLDRLGDFLRPLFQAGLVATLDEQPRLLDVSGMTPQLRAIDEPPFNQFDHPVDRQIRHRDVLVIRKEG